MWGRIKLAFIKFFLCFWLKYCYRRFSLINQRVREKKYKECPQKESWLVSTVLNFYKSCEWVSDPLGGKWDYVSKPEKFYMTREGDCDDWAHFAVTMLIKDAHSLSISWKEQSGKYNGHVVCVHKDTDGKFWHMGNWGLCGPFDNLDKVVESILPQDATGLAVSLRDRRLKCVRCWKL